MALWNKTPKSTESPLSEAKRHLSETIACLESLEGNKTFVSVIEKTRVSLSLLESYQQESEKEVYGRLE